MLHVKSIKWVYITNYNIKLNFNFLILIEGRTHCVDTTITNILEGRVSYIPEKEGNEPKPPGDGKSTSSELSGEVG